MDMIFQYECSCVRYVTPQKVKKKNMLATTSLDLFSHRSLPMCLTSQVLSFYSEKSFVLRVRVLPCAKCSLEPCMCHNSGLNPIFVIVPSCLSIVLGSVCPAMLLKKVECELFA